MYLSLKENYPYGPLEPLHTLQVESVYECGSSTLNEDRLLMAGDLFGVFDGATSIGQSRSEDGLTGGAAAAELAKQTFLGADTGLHAAMCRANSEIRKAQEDDGGGIGERHELWSTSAAVVRVGDNFIEYCQTGDSLVMFLYEDGGHRIATPAVDQDRETMILWKKLVGETNSNTGSIYEKLQTQIEKVRRQMNRSYGVLNGEPEAENFILSGYEKSQGVTDILLFTDGLYLPKEDPEQASDWQTFVSLYRRGGLHAVHERVRSQQGADPDCTLYPRFKCHDDIAAIAITLE